jgi:hypothetical protein
MEECFEIMVMMACSPFVALPVLVAGDLVGLFMILGGVQKSSDTFLYGGIATATISTLYGVCGTVGFFCCERGSGSSSSRSSTSDYGSTWVPA